MSCAIALLDAHYAPAHAIGACVVLSGWTGSEPIEAVSAWIDTPADYVPGAFYLRELPALLAAIKQVRTPIGVYVVDGYVTLNAGRPGLGAHLAGALATPTPIVGIAKSPFRDACAVPVRRGNSRRPLYVSA